MICLLTTSAGRRLKIRVCFDRPYYRWRIELNWPKDGHISFAASGFSQVLRAAAVLRH